jgi:hypothetical protein
MQTSNHIDSFNCKADEPFLYGRNRIDAMVTCIITRQFLAQQIQ